eukprot:4973578-Amphidinium_carterae.1
MSLGTLIIKTITDQPQQKYYAYGFCNLGIIFVSPVTAVPSPVSRERNSGKKRLERGVAAAAAYRRHGHAVVGEDDAADLEECETYICFQKLSSESINLVLEDMPLARCKLVRTLAPGWVRTSNVNCQSEFRFV